MIFMIIRDLELSDFDAVGEIFKQLHGLHVKHRPDIYRDVENPAEANGYIAEEVLNEENLILLGADVDSKIVGICFIVIRTPRNDALFPRVCAYIDNIAVDENYRRRGIGTALYNEAVKRAKEREAEVIQLQVSEFNKAALDFYKSLGMTVWEYKMEQRI